MLSRSKPANAPGQGAGGGANAPGGKDQKKKKKLPKLEEFLQARDYVGAMTLLEVKIATNLP